MASYIELVQAQADTTLRQRVAVACVVAADSIRTEDVATANHTARLAWAKKVYDSPTTTASSMLWSVLAQNKAASLSAIVASTDAQLQTAVDAAVAAFL